MSKSYKRTPVYQDPSSRWYKRQASKAVRRHARDISNGKWYRKLYCSWNIHEYRFYRPYSAERLRWERNELPRYSLAEFNRYWAQCYKRK